VNDLRVIRTLHQPRSVFSNDRTCRCRPLLWHFFVYPTTETLHLRPFLPTNTRSTTPSTQKHYHPHPYYAWFEEGCCL